MEAEERLRLICAIHRRVPYRKGALERRPSQPQAKPERFRRGLTAGDLWAGKYDVGSAASPEALRQQLMALQKQPAAIRALRDAMLLEGKVTQS